MDEASPVLWGKHAILTKDCQPMESTAHHSAYRQGDTIAESPKLDKAKIGQASQTPGSRMDWQPYLLRKCGDRYPSSFKNLLWT